MTKNKLPATGKYQIYAVEPATWSNPKNYTLDECWGSYQAAFDSQESATDAVKSLAENYPEIGWAVADPDGWVCSEIEPSESS